MTVLTSAGLSAAEAADRLRRDGPNALPTPPEPSPWVMLLKQFTHFFAVMLWVAVVLALVAGLPQLAVAIAVVVLLNGVFAFAQEYRADRATARLRDLLPLEATVVRDGVRVVVPATGLVVGDIVLLAAGDRVCADLVLRVAADVAVDESMLTGESAPVRPAAGAAVHAGTFVVQGEATAEVAAVAGSTRLADIAKVVREAHPPVSPLTRSLNRVVTVVAFVALGVGLLFFGLALALGTPARDGLLFAIGVTVALVPEGLLPTVTLSLARAASSMADRNALVRRLDAVETLGATTFVCTDKTGTLTRNEMSVVAVWTPRGAVEIPGSGYRPEPLGADGSPTWEAVRTVATSGLIASTGYVEPTGDGAWRPRGDSMEAALHVLVLRLHDGHPSGAGPLTAAPVEVLRRWPFDPQRRRVSAATADGLHVKGSVESVLRACADAPPDVLPAAAEMATRGLRVIAVARRALPGGPPGSDGDGSAVAVETGLTLLGLVGFEDPPREGAAEAVADLRAAGIRVAMVTGDHPLTARAIAAEVGLLVGDQLVVEGRELPADIAALGELLDRDGVVVARVSPEDKLRIAQSLQARGHVVAMTGDGVNDGPALREADIGVAMGLGGTDVAREAADLVLLDDHLATMVGAVELGRATFTNVRRFLTYHLTDNVAELTPFVVWALSGGQFPLALAVLQVLALDIGTDLLPALALGAEPPDPRTMEGPMRSTVLLDRRTLRRVFGFLGPAEAIVEMVAFTVVLLLGGWAWGLEPSAGLLAVASGTAFAAVVLGQLANAFACRSESRWVLGKSLRANRLLLGAVVVEMVLLVVFLGFGPLARLLGQSWPSPSGWALAALAIPAVVAADALEVALFRRRRG